jgi:hypothetical protein
MMASVQQYAAFSYAVGLATFIRSPVCSLKGQWLSIRGLYLLLSSKRMLHAERANRRISAIRNLFGWSR